MIKKIITYITGIVTFLFVLFMSLSVYSSNVERTIELDVVSGSMFPTVQTNESLKLHSVTRNKVFERFEMIGFNVDLKKIYPDYIKNSKCSSILDKKNKCFKKNKALYLKRIIGLPNDEIRVENNGKNIYINDIEIKHTTYKPTVKKIKSGEYEIEKLNTVENIKFTYLTASYEDKSHKLVEVDHYYRKLKNTTFKLTDDQFFVMGDNRVYSIDSRKIGAIEASQIKYYVK